MDKRELDMIDALEYAVWAALITAFTGGVILLCS